MFVDAFYKLSTRVLLIVNSDFQTYWKHKNRMKTTFNSYKFSSEIQINGNEPCVLLHLSCCTVYYIWIHSCVQHLMLFVLFIYPNSKPPSLAHIRVKPWMIFFFYLTVSGPRRSIALSVIYCVTVGPRHTPNSSHLVAVATGHRTLKHKITHIHAHA